MRRCKFCLERVVPGGKEGVYSHLGDDGMTHGHGIVLWAACGRMRTGDPDAYHYPLPTIDETYEAKE